MRVNYVIDWLSFNAVDRYDLNPVLMAHKFAEWKWSETNGTFGYTKAVVTNDGCKVMWNPERRDMGVFCTYPGRCLNSYRGRNVASEEILHRHIANGDICRRIDVALDVHDSKINIKQMASALRRGKADTQVRKHAFLESSAGQTLYIGSRESEMFMRVYDKAKEQGDFTADYKRIELELKGSRAVEFSRILSEVGEIEGANRTRKLMKSMVDFRIEIWRQIIGDVAVGIAKAKDNEPDTASWLLASVAPTLGRYITRSQDKTFLERFLTIVAAFVEEE